MVSGEAELAQARLHPAVGPPQRLGIGQPDGDQSGVVLVRDLAARGLEHHRIADRVGGPERLLAGIDGAAVDHRDAEAAQHLRAFQLREEARGTGCPCRAPQCRACFGVGSGAHRGAVLGVSRLAGKAKLVIEHAHAVEAGREITEDRDLFARVVILDLGPQPAGSNHDAGRRRARPPLHQQIDDRPVGRDLRQHVQEGQQRTVQAVGLHRRKQLLDLLPAAQVATVDRIADGPRALATRRPPRRCGRPTRHAFRRRAECRSPWRNRRAAIRRRPWRSRRRAASCPTRRGAWSTFCFDGN